MYIEASNPSTQEVITRYSLFSPEQTRRLIDQAHNAFLKWRKTSFEDRARLMHRIAQLLKEKKEHLAALATREMGKPIRQSRSEIDKCVLVCEYYADHAAGFLEKEVIATDASKSYVHFAPMGVLLAVMPWNFPYWQVFRFAAPALMAGNTALLKHAPNVPACALAIEDIFREADFPEHILSNLIIDVDQVKDIISNQKVKAVTLTGSGKAGSAVASLAGQAIKKTVLELGGSDAYVILEDADIKAAASICAKSRLLNSGQSCIGAKRFILMENIYDQFLEYFTDHLKAATLGDPMDEHTDIGPLARVDLRDELHRQVRESIQQGAQCLLGGQLPDGKGYFYPPTILSNIQRGMPAYHEELFGPVASVFKVKTLEEAVQLANDTDFGLGAAVFTNDIEKGEHIASELLEAGSCFVNKQVRSDPRLPFGGTGISGYGRELSHYGIKEFTNIKTIYVQ